MTDHPEFDFNEKPKKRKKSLWERYHIYHKANPHVMPILVNMAYEVSRSGQRNIGINMLFEVLRWKINVETVKTEGFKISDPLAAVYVRFILRDHPDLRGVFVLKKSQVNPYFPDLEYLKSEHTLETEDDNNE